MLVYKETDIHKLNKNMTEAIFLQHMIIII